jgi:hypothetical protein
MPTVVWQQDPTCLAKDILTVLTATHSHTNHTGYYTRSMWEPRDPTSQGQSPIASMRQRHTQIPTEFELTNVSRLWSHDRSVVL